MNKVTLNFDTKLYVIEDGYGYSCLGFEVMEKWASKLAKELNLEWEAGSPSIERYNKYQDMCKIAKERHESTGWKSESQLTPELIGLEGKRVEVVNSWGEKDRFIVGRSTGFIPCHIARKTVNSTGGCGVCGSPFQSVRVVG